MSAEPLPTSTEPAVQLLGRDDIAEDSVGRADDEDASLARDGADPSPEQGRKSRRRFHDEPPDLSELERLRALNAATSSRAEANLAVLDAIPRNRRVLAASRLTGMRDDPTAQSLADLRWDLHMIYAWLGEAATSEPDPAVAAILSGLQVEIDAVRQTLAQIPHRDPGRLVRSTRNLVAAALDIAKDAEALRARDRTRPPAPLSDPSPPPP